MTPRSPAGELAQAADVIFDRFMPLCRCDDPVCATTARRAVEDVVRRIVKAINDRVDELGGDDR